MPFLEEVEECFGSRDLYTALGISKNASARDIKVAYRKISLKVHPDRVGESDKAEATRKFQILGKAYQVLSDEDQRKIYDETGSVHDETDDIFDWKKFWASRFGNFEETVQAFTDKYWGSKEEEEDLKQCYIKFKGDMTKIIRDMFCRALEHEPRYRELISSWIAKGEVQNFDAFSKETDAKRRARKRRYEKEAAIAEQNAKIFQKEMGSSIPDIAEAIARRNADRLKKQDEFLDRLAEKYAAPKKRKKGSTSKKQKA